MSRTVTMQRDAIDTDETRWPVVVHTTVGTPTDAQVDAFIARADAILRRRTPHVVVFDNSNAGKASAYMRQRSMDWLRENGPLMTQHCAGVALVFRSAALRFVMSTVMLVTSHAAPYEVCATLPEALGWAERQLASRRRER